MCNDGEVLKSYIYICTLFHGLQKLAPEKQQKREESQTSHHNTFKNTVTYSNESQYFTLWATITEGSRGL